MRRPPGTAHEHPRHRLLDVCISVPIYVTISFCQRAAPSATLSRLLPITRENNLISALGPANATERATYASESPAWRKAAAELELRARERDRDQAQRAEAAECAWRSASKESIVVRRTKLGPAPLPLRRIQRSPRLDLDPASPPAQSQRPTRRRARRDQIRSPVLARLLAASFKLSGGDGRHCLRGGGRAPPTSS